MSHIVILNPVLYIAWFIDSDVSATFVFSAMSLISEVIRYASGLSLCRGVYLHVIAHNNPAIRLYQRLMFRCVRRLHRFYLIKQQHFDAFLFVYFINGSRTPCSPL